MTARNLVTLILLGMPLGTLSCGDRVGGPVQQGGSDGSLGGAGVSGSVGGGGRSSNGGRAAGDDGGVGPEAGAPGGDSSVSGAGCGADCAALAGAGSGGSYSGSSFGGATAGDADDGGLGEGISGAGAANLGGFAGIAGAVASGGVGGGSAGAATGGTADVGCSIDKDCSAVAHCVGGQQRAICVPEFDTCNSDADCPTDTYCDSYCRAAPLKGAPCSESGRCGRDSSAGLLTCTNGFCQASANPNHCKVDLDCGAGGLCQQLPNDSALVCHERGALGQYCNGDTSCADGLVCNNNTPPPAPGYLKCTLPLHCLRKSLPSPLGGAIGHCARGTFCSAGLGGVCQQDLPLGSPCLPLDTSPFVSPYDFNGACASGLFCKDPGDGTKAGTCTRSPGVGERCAVPLNVAASGDLACLDYDNGGCSVCAVGLQCAAGYCRVAGAANADCSVSPCAADLRCAPAHANGTCSPPSSGQGGSNGTGGNTTGGAGGTGGAGAAGANSAGGSNVGQSSCVPRAGGCDLNSDCSVGAYCVNAQCQLGSGLNEPCQAGCQAGLACIGGLCVPPTLLCTTGTSSCGVGVQAECVYVTNNGACLPTGQPSCYICEPAGVGGLRCTSQWQCGSAGYCAPGNFGGQCFARGAENATCNPQYDSCLSGLYCAYVGTSGRCLPIPGQGESCGLNAAGSYCQPTLFCDATPDVCTSQEDGDPCISGSCPAALYCDGTTCRTRHGLGGACEPGQCEPTLRCAPAAI